MKKALVLALALAPGAASAQCDAGFVQGSAPGTWQVNNAGGEGFGGWFVTGEGEVVHEDKPQVAVQATEDGLAIGHSGELALDGFHAEAGDNGRVGKVSREVGRKGCRMRDEG